MLKSIKKILPWVFCLLIFAYLFYKVPFSEMGQAIQLVNIPAFILLSLVYFLAMHILDCFSLSQFIHRFAAPIKFKECWQVRGVSYLIMILNYHAAQGAFAFYFKKKYGAPLAKTLGTLVFISAMDLILVLTSGLVAVEFAGNTPIPSELKSYLLSLIPLLYIGYFVWILFWKNTSHPLIKKLEGFRPIKWLLHHDIFHIFREASWVDFAKLFILRFPIIILVIGIFNPFLMTLGYKIPWGDLFLYNPIITIITTIPLTPSGLGTGQLLAIEFFKTSLACEKTHQDWLFALQSVSPHFILPSKL